MSSKNQKLFDSAFKAASKSGALRSAEARNSVHTRYVGDVTVEVIYKGPKLQDGVERPWYVVVLKLGHLRHRLSLGGARNWYHVHGLPSDAKAIDAITSSAIAFACEPDGNTPLQISSAIRLATSSALRSDGTYTLRKTDKRKV